MSFTVVWYDSAEIVILTVWGRAGSVHLGWVVASRGRRRVPAPFHPLQALIISEILWDPSTHPCSQLHVQVKPGLDVVEGTGTHYTNLNDNRKVQIKEGRRTHHGSLVLVDHHFFSFRNYVSARDKTQSSKAAGTMMASRVRASGSYRVKLSTRWEITSGPRRLSPEQSRLLWISDWVRVESVQG